MKWDYIINPEDGKQVNIFSKIGRNVLTKYMIYNQSGGGDFLKDIYNTACSEYDNYRDVFKLFYEIFSKINENTIPRESYSNWVRRYKKDNPYLCHCASCLNIAWYRTLPCSTLNSGDCGECSICDAKKTEELYSDECCFNSGLD
tara:strand:+ start:141 stop:575 length:435 start_codon:yes stop_codon:yes gene_type:complete